MIVEVSIGKNGIIVLKVYDSLKRYGEPEQMSYKNNKKQSG